MWLVIFKVKLLEQEKKIAGLEEVYQHPERRQEQYDAELTKTKSMLEVNTSSRNTSSRPFVVIPIAWKIDSTVHVAP